MNKPSNVDEIAVLQNGLVDKLISMGCITSHAVESAFRAVSRHLFVPGVDLERVYNDNSIPTKRADGQLVSSSSQPAIMAIMLEQLQLQPGHRVLEIGAGTGYNAALIQHLVGNSGLVVTVDIDEDIVEGTREHLKSADFESVRAICGDGGLGYVDHAPYDRIILTVGAWDIIPAWWEQLKPGGCLLLPLEISGGIQKSISFENKGNHLESVSVKDCGFMNLRGAFAKLQTPTSLGPEPGLSISVNDGVNVDSDTVYRLLSGPYEDLPSGLYARPGEVIFGGLAFWLTFRELGFCLLSAEGDSADLGIIPSFMVLPGERKTCLSIGLMGDGELCALVRPPGADSSSEQTDGSQAFELIVRSYGSGTTLARSLLEQTEAWNAAGRPSGNELGIRVYKKDTDYMPSTDELLVVKRWTKLVLGRE